MSDENSISQAPRMTERDASQEAAPQAAFSIPDDLAKRYEIRAIEGRSEAERRVGMFTPGNAKTPALEISNERIVANRDDRETIESLVKLAQHNEWEGLTVAGSDEFRKAVWKEASRAGLEVNGYEPTFAEREAVERQRREEAERERKDAERLRKDGKAEKDGEAEQVVEAAEIAMEAASPAPAQAVTANLAKAGERVSAPGADGEESHEDVTSLLQRKSALVEELNDVLREDPSLSSQTVSEFILKQPSAQMRLGDAGASNETLAARNLMSESIIADTARNQGNLSKTVGEYLRDQDREIGELARSRGLEVPDGKAARDELVAETLQQRNAFSEFLTSKDAARSAERDNEKLADLFLNGSQEQRQAEPRLANALDAEAEMRRHLEAAFEGNHQRIEVVSQEGRQMISDVLRRGLDVSVREPAPVRQIEPIQTNQMER
ncbi:LPD7 domain-containing protein (plasmid) [Novosphingobium aerophilum]|uniref:LPD7 domain-containing protein n=1 Tax=Novosphingobium aerophilum TaxID=2839843 RepID=UPI003FD0A9DE